MSSDLSYRPIKPLLPAEVSTVFSSWWLAVFAGLVAYDTQWIARNAATIAEKGDEQAAGKIALTYAVPYSVSTYSALEVNRLPG